MVVEFVQYTDYHNNVGSTGISTISGLNITNNNFLGAVVNYYYTSGTVVSDISDSLGNTYIKAISMPRTTGNTEICDIWYSKNCIGGSGNIVSARFSASGVLYRYISVSEFSGVDISSPLIGSSANYTSGETHNSGYINSLSEGDLIIGGLCSSDLLNFTSGEMFNLLSSDVTNIYNIAEYSILGEIGSYNASFTSSDNTSTIVCAAIFSISSEQPISKINSNLTLIAGAGKK